MFAHILFAVLAASTPQCHAGQVTDCHYSDSVSVTTTSGVIFAEVHQGRYTATFYPN